MERREVVFVREYGGTYIARCCGKIASCTSSPQGAIRAVVRKVAGADPARILARAKGRWVAIVEEARR